MTHSAEDRRLEVVTMLLEGFLQMRGVNPMAFYNTRRDGQRLIDATGSLARIQGILDSTLEHYGVSSLDTVATTEYFDYALTKFAQP